MSNNISPPPPEKLFDSAGHMRALVNAQKLRYTEIDGFGYYPSLEFFYDTDQNLRGFICPEGVGLKGGHDEKSVYWKITKEDFVYRGPYLALIKFYDPEKETAQRVLDGKYDRVIELPVEEGIFFFSTHIADAIVECKELADMILKHGLLSIRHYVVGYVQDESDPFLNKISIQQATDK